MTNTFILILSLFVSPDKKDIRLTYSTLITNGTAFVDIQCGNTTNWLSGAVNMPNKEGTNTFYMNLSNPNYFAGCESMGKLRVRIVK